MWPYENEENKISDCVFYHLCISVNGEISLQIRTGSVHRWFRKAYFFAGSNQYQWQCKPEEGVVFQNGVWLKSPDLARAKELLIEDKLKGITECHRRIDTYERHIDAIVSFQETVES